MLCHQASCEMLEMGKQQSIKAQRELSSQWLHFANEETHTQGGVESCPRPIKPQTKIKDFFIPG